MGFMVATLTTLNVFFPTPSVKFLVQGPVWLARGVVKMKFFECFEVFGWLGSFEYFLPFCMATKQCSILLCCFFFLYLHYFQLFFHLFICLLKRSMRYASALKWFLIFIPSPSPRSWQPLFSFLYSQVYAGRRSSPHFNSSCALSAPTHLFNAKT